MNIKFYLSFICCSILLFSCTNAKKLYQKGRYDEAVVLAAKKLGNLILRLPAGMGKSIFVTWTITQIS